MNRSHIDTLFIELTTACNLNCIHCGYRKQQQHKINTEIVYTSVSRLKKHGLQTVMLTGGEPTLHPNISEILSFCKNNEIKTKVATNGTRLDVLLPAMEEDILDEIVISADAFSDVTYKSIRRSDFLKRIYESICSMNQYCERIHLSYLIQRSNYKELLVFLEFAERLGVDSVSLLVPHYNGDFTGLLSLIDYRKQVFLSKEDSANFAKNIAPELLYFWEKHPNILRYSSKHIHAIIDYLSDMSKPITCRETICSLPLNSLFLYSDESVRLCPYQKEWSFNNLDEALTDLSQKRIQCYFDGKRKNSYCLNCLEVAL